MTAPTRHLRPAVKRLMAQTVESLALVEKFENRIARQGQLGCAAKVSAKAGGGADPCNRLIWVSTASTRAAMPKWHSK